MGRVPDDRQRGTNLRPDGTPKIDVNKEDLEELHKELVEALGTEMANFIVAYRQGGPFEGDDIGQPASGIKLDLKQPGRQKLSTILDLIGVKTRIATQPAGGENNQGQSEGQNQNSGQNQNEGSSEKPQGSPGKESSRTVVSAAFSDERGTMKSYLTKLMDNLTVNSEDTIPGRLNINQARGSFSRASPASLERRLTRSSRLAT